MASFTRILRKVQKSKIGNLLLKPSTIEGDLSLFSDEKKLIAYVKQAIADADGLKSKLTSPSGQEILQLFGQCSERNRHLLNNLCSIKDANYLEIGTYQGTSFVSAIYGNEKTIHPLVIDNWSLFGGPSFLFFQNCQIYIKGKYELIWRDCWQVSADEVKAKHGNNNKVHVYLYDADHSYQSQYDAYIKYNDALNDLFVTVVDDYNNDEVEKGTQDAFRDLGYEVLFEQHLPARFVGDSEQWWNGYYVAVVSKPKK
ncbi:hypothetical protein BH09BAC1_BH09BAC1_11920 [soil metagenome]